MSEHSYWNQVRDLVASGHERRRPKHEIREQIVHLVQAAESAGEDWAADTLTRWATSGADADYTRVFKDQNTVTYIRKDGRRMKKTVGYSRPMRSADSGEIIGRQLQAWWGMSRTAIAALTADQIEQNERLTDSIAALLQVLSAMDRHPECPSAAEAWEADGRTLDEIELGRGRMSTITAGSGPTHPPNPRPENPPPPPRRAAMGYPAPDPLPPPPPPVPAAMHRHPSGRTCAGAFFELPVGLARGVLAELRIRSMAAVDNVHGRVTA